MEQLRLTSEQSRFVFENKLSKCRYQSQIIPVREQKHVQF